MACGWSPFGSKSDAMTKRLPPSDFSGRGGPVRRPGLGAEFRPALAQQPFERLLAGDAAKAARLRRQVGAGEAIFRIAFLSDLMRGAGGTGDASSVSPSSSASFGSRPVTGEAV